MSYCLVTRKPDQPEQLAWFHDPRAARQAFHDTPPDTGALLVRVGPPHTITATRLAPLVTLHDLERALRGG